MEREPNDPNSNSARTIFRTYLIVLGIDLVIAIVVTYATFVISGSPMSAETTQMTFGLILLIIAAVQLLIILPANLILLILGKGEIAVGLLLADITLFFLGYLVCIA